MAIECGQGGLRIDRGPLQRCVYWDLGEEVWRGRYIGALDAVFLNSPVGGFTHCECWDTHIHTPTHNGNMAMYSVCIKPQ